MDSRKELDKYMETFAFAHCSFNALRLWFYADRVVQGLGSRWMTSRGTQREETMEDGHIHTYCTMTIDEGLFVRTGRAFAEDEHSGSHLSVGTNAETDRSEDCSRRHAPPARRTNTRWLATRPASTCHLSPHSAHAFNNSIDTTNSECSGSKEIANRLPSSDRRSTFSRIPTARKGKGELNRRKTNS